MALSQSSDQHNFYDDVTHAFALQSLPGTPVFTSSQLSYDMRVETTSMPDFDLDSGSLQAIGDQLYEKHEQKMNTNTGVISGSLEQSLFVKAMQAGIVKTIDYDEPFRRWIGISTSVAPPNLQQHTSIIECALHTRHYCNQTNTYYWVWYVRFVNKHQDKKFSSLRMKQVQKMLSLQPGSNWCTKPYAVEEDCIKYCNEGAILEAEVMGAKSLHKSQNVSKKRFKRPADLDMDLIHATGCHGDCEGCTVPLDRCVKKMSLASQ